VLHLEEVPSPQPRRGQVRLRAERIGVAFGDVMRRRGVLAPWWPFTPGYDLVGRVDAVGPGVDPARIGDRCAVLMPSTGFGAYAEEVVVPAALLVDVPDDVSVDHALALGLNYITARQILTRLTSLPTGARVLVHGAAGGVGTALLDVGGALGFDLYGTASAAKHDVLRARGATPIDYRNEDFVARVADLTDDGVDLVTDPIGGPQLDRSHAALRPGGTLVFFGVTGALQGGTLGLLAEVFRVARLWARPGRRVRAYGIGTTPSTSARRCQEDWTALIAAHRQGAFTPLVGEVVPFEDVRAAHDLVDRSAVSGKVLLSV
jgi:NADPH:quinone reductase-like Zn-dependent oxidoreductase